MSSQRDRGFKAPRGSGERDSARPGWAGSIALQQGRRDRRPLERLRWGSLVVAAGATLATALALPNCSRGDTRSIDLLEPSPADAGAPREAADCEHPEPCTEPTPHCLGTRCVACRSDADCGAKFCGPGNECMECVEDLQCPDAKPHCNGNRCVECSTSSDCASTDLACHPSESKCAARCSSDEDCDPAKPHCSESFEVCVQCSTAADCGAATPVCDAGKCVQCTRNSDCSAELPSCDPAKQKCVECLENGECSPELPICEASKQKCVECVGDADCAAELRCDKGECVP